VRLVTTNNVEVFRHLGNAAFQRLGIEHDVASSGDDVFEILRKGECTIAILDVELAGGSGYDVCRAIKDDDVLKSIHVILLLSSVITRKDLERINACGCDDVLALPLHTDDFYHHLAQVAGLPFRKDRRIGVELELSSPDADASITGTVVNVSSGGIGIQIGCSIDVGDAFSATLRHDGESYPAIKAKVIWTRPADEPDVTAAGLAFVSEPPAETRLLLELLALYDVTTLPEGGVTVSLQGDFTEITDFSGLAKRLEREKTIDFDAAAVRYISSAGVRSWCEFLDELSGKTYTFRHCSIAFASQASMVPLVVGEGQVVSVEAPYRCESCDRDDLRLLETKALLHDGEHITPPSLRCLVCGDELEFDDVPDRFFAFLRPSDD